MSKNKPVLENGNAFKVKKFNATLGRIVTYTYSVIEHRNGYTLCECSLQNGTKFKECFLDTDLEKILKGEIIDNNEG